MKETIKQLEKEIEDIESCWLENHPFPNPNLPILKAKLQTLQDVYEEINEFDIDKELKDFEGKRTNFVNLGMELFKAKILKKFQGEEE